MTDPSQNRKKKKITIIASPQGVEKAENALIKLGFYSKSNFAQSQLLARNTVTKFFQRQPIQLDSFKRICEALKLEWIDIVEEEQSERIERTDRSRLENSEVVGQTPTPGRQVTVIDTLSKKIKAEIILKGDINSDHNFKILQLILQEHSGDTITITDIQEGSIRLIVEGSQKHIERLVFQFKSGKLKEVNDFPVEDAQILDDKWPLVQEIVSQPVKDRNLIGADLSDADLSGADLSDANLSGADLSGADLSGANLSDADLSGADLSDADLSGADLSGVNLSDTDLSGAIIDSKTKLDDTNILEDVQLVPGETSGSQNLILRHNVLSVKLIFANLIRGNLGSAFRILINLFSADLSGANLSGAYLSGANLSGVNLSGANLKGANLKGANLRGANLSGANLKGAKLRGANLRGADLRGANLRGADLRGADIRGADLRGANLSDTYLSDTNLSRTDLRGANLSDINLSDTNLSNANLSRADLRGADLRGANLSRADLSDANLSRADLRGADIRGANLSRADLSDANLSGTHLSGANLIGAHLIGANLSGANLIGAHLIGAHLSDAYLSGAIVVNALFGGSKGLTEDTKQDLKQRGAIFDDKQRKTIFSDPSPVPKPK
ncbi:pentapeptide repeat-containing protein [Brasilonema sp. CT11]|nr:pentapeptide repeat-containing protein [Brasilonema sp. CT11]